MNLEQYKDPLAGEDNGYGGRAVGALLGMGLGGAGGWAARRAGAKIMKEAEELGGILNSGNVGRKSVKDVGNKYIKDVEFAERMLKNPRAVRRMEANPDFAAKQLDALKYENSMGKLVAGGAALKGGLVGMGVGGAYDTGDWQPGVRDTAMLGGLALGGVYGHLLPGRRFLAGKVVDPNLDNVAKKAAVDGLLKNKAAVDNLKSLQNSFVGPTAGMLAGYGGYKALEGQIPDGGKKERREAEKQLTRMTKMMHKNYEPDSAAFKEYASNITLVDYVDEQAREAGLDPTDPAVRAALVQAAAR